ncbi:MAG TPA: hypothetical protein PLA90_12530, partial [Candidatus Sumerlaeota bacterium]|nr:hypothetical protein [Candidatus Sumerlaeota bacterium]
MLPSSPPEGSRDVPPRPARPDSPPAALPLEDLIGEKDQCRVANAFVEALPRSSVEGRFRH